MKHVVIAGGGFAGVRLARKLGKQNQVSISLINDSGDFRYCPALYRAATGFKMGTARLPLEWMLLDKPNIELVIGKVTGLDNQKKQVLLESGSLLDYDYVAFALGSVTTYFNIEGLHERSFGIKTPKEIIKLRKHLHSKIAERSKEQENYVIVGAGPTGVELSGALGEYLKRISKKHMVKNNNLKIWLVEAGPRILPQMSEKSAMIVTKRLETLGVNVLINTVVKKETINSLKTSTGNIKTHTVVWTAGTTNNPFFGTNEIFETAVKGKVVVDGHLQAANNVYVLGDSALTPHSGLAMTAIKHADYVAKDIKRRLHGHKRPAHVDATPPQVVPTGKRWAIMQYKGLVLRGLPVAAVRRIADFIGYSDVLGVLKAMTIFSSSEILEDSCAVCNRTK